MNLLILDDEPYALNDLKNLLLEICPDSHITACQLSHTALEAARKKLYDIAFLDIELGISNGILLAKQLKELQPSIHIIFTTSYTEYAVDAFALHATGYLLKPIQKAHIERELNFIYGMKNTPATPPKKKLQVKTFGGFSVFSNNNKLIFKRQKAKELLAYLIERNGQSINIREACGILFEDMPYNQNMKSYFHTILADLKNTLADADASDILIKSYNSLSVDTSKIDCDYYRFLKGDPIAINEYQGEFMTCYSWAEFRTATLNQKL